MSGLVWCTSHSLIYGASLSALNEREKERAGKKKKKKKRRKRKRRIRTICGTCISHDDKMFPLWESSAELNFPFQEGGRTCILFYVIFDFVLSGKRVIRVTH